MVTYFISTQNERVYKPLHIVRQQQLTRRSYKVLSLCFGQSGGDNSRTYPKDVSDACELSVIMHEAQLLVLEALGWKTRPTRHTACNACTQ